MAGKKQFTNKTRVTLNITLLVRQGGNVLAPSLEETFTLNPQESKLITYGNSANSFLNGLFVQWTDPATQATTTIRQEMNASGRQPTLDWLLNTHSRILIKAASGLTITAT